MEKPKQNKNDTSRHWVFTCFDKNAIEKFEKKEYTNEWLEQSKPIRYIIMGLEKCPTSGKMHLQGYAEFSKPVRISNFQAVFPKAHCEKRAKNATREDNKKYCSKDGNFVELGEWEAGGQGARNDLKSVMTMIKEDKPQLEIFESEPETVSRHLRFFDRYRALIEKEQTKTFRKVEVEVLVGPAGCGKTKKAFDTDPDLFTVNPDDNFPFEGYNGEKTILIDDFGGANIRYHHLLRILDGHQYRCNVKGGHRYARWTKIFITSNEHPRDWYCRGLDEPLKRRITKIEQFPSVQRTLHNIL